jgi:hypothetical protein
MPIQTINAVETGTQAGNPAQKRKDIPWPDAP